MNDTKAVDTSDLLQNFKAVPDIRSRLIIAGLTLLCLFLPMASTSVFGVGASFGIDHPALLGSWAHWLSLLAIASCVAPAFAATRALTRLLDGLLGFGAVLAGIVVALRFIQAFSEIAMASSASRSLTGQRFDSSDFVSFSPSFGLVLFIVLVGFAAIRGFKALRSKPLPVPA